MFTTDGVKPLTPHGLCHTCASLLLQQRVPPNVVQRRLGHKNVVMTSDVYAHVLPTMQEGAARRIGAQLYR
jgi:integrase